MNAKKAKAIRKEIGYHPTDERNYVKTYLENIRRRGRSVEVSSESRAYSTELDPKCSRFLYQEMKKEVA